MHVYFSGIGGTAIGPLAMIAHKAGYDVSGSDKQASNYIDYLKNHGVNNIHIGQTYEQMAEVNTQRPIDWYVYSSAVSIEQPDAPELKFCRDHDIKATKRDEFLNHLIQAKNLKLIAVAGTHGKTTTTAMAIWLLKNIGLPLTYSVGAKIPFGDMGEYDKKSEYFVLEADEFDRNFLAFKPYMSIVTGVDWDHHEIFPTRGAYEQAFKDFLKKSDHSVIWQSDKAKLEPLSGDCQVLNDDDPRLAKIKLRGLVNRRNAWQVINALGPMLGQSEAELVRIMNEFPGLSRRFEELVPNLYSDYAHTTAKIRGAIQTALEISSNVVVIYEPLTNRRQHFIKQDYKDLFKDIKKLYWVPSYLAREDPDQPVLEPADLIKYMDNPEVAEPASLNDNLRDKIQHHLKSNDLVVCISGGGGGSLDEWIRREFV